MKLTLAIAAALALTCATSSPADAKPRRAKSTKMVKKKKDTTKDKKKVRNFDFLADEIDGDKIAPDGTTLWGRDAVKHSNLIRLRPHFVVEIVKTSEKL